MTVASRIAVMNHGELVQIATPGDIYENPQTSYVAAFIGDVNLFEGKVSSLANGYADIEWPSGKGRFRALAPAGLSVGQQVWLALRPEKLKICKNKTAGSNNAIPGKVDDVGYLGSTSHFHSRVANGQRVTVLRANAAQTVEDDIRWEDDVWIEWPAEAGVVLTR